MTMELGSNGCDAPCTACGVRCAVCSDVSGNAVSMLLTLPDVITQSDPDPGAGGDYCEDCEDILAITHELTLMSEVDSVSVIADVESTCGFDEDVDVNDSSQFCVYEKGFACGRPTVFRFTVQMYVIIYRTTGGDLYAKVFYRAVYTDASGFGPCGDATVVISDEFLLASGSTQFDCGALDHDGAFSTCSGTDPACWCSIPVDYNLTVAT